MDSVGSRRLRADSERTFKSSGLRRIQVRGGVRSEPPTSPPESASGVESASGLVRGGHSTGPPRSRSESAADFKVRLESAGVRWSPLGVRQNSFESKRNTFWRSSAGVRSESGGSAAESTPRRIVPNNLFAADYIYKLFLTVTMTS